MLEYEIVSTDKIRVLEYLYKNKESLTVYDDNNNFLTKKKSQNMNFFLMSCRNNEVLFCLNLGKYIFKFNETNVIINYREEGLPIPTYHDPDYFTRLTLSSENEETITELIKNAFKINDKNKKNTNIYIPNEQGEWYNYGKIPSRNLDSIYINDAIKNKIVEDIKHFIDSEDEYNKFGMPYKKTYLLTGIAGSGKTSLVKALCHNFEYNLSILSVSKAFTNTSLVNCVRELNEKTVLLIEDIDCLFEKRNATSDNPSLTFSNLLNILDGVLYKHGSIIFLTTNHPEKLDHALMRIGRVDMIFEINYPCKKQIKNMFDNMMDISNNDTDENDFKNFYDCIRDKKITMSAIINFLFRYREKWNDNINELIDTDIFIKEKLGNGLNVSLYS